MHILLSTKFIIFLSDRELKYVWVITMKKKAATWLMAFLIAVVFPGVIFNVSQEFIHIDNPDLPATEPPLQDSQHTPTYMHKINVLLLDGTVKEMELENYLVGVVLGEMPADFELEALKAQAVVARTYTLKRNTTGQKHPNGAVCTNASCCQAYRPVADYIAANGAEEFVERVSEAVEKTAGQVLLYNGKLIEATYFSCSGGRTEDAVAVWGTEIPYLQAVDSPGEENAKYYTDSLTFAVREFADLLNLNTQIQPACWIGTIRYTDGGGVDTIEIAGKTFKGTTLRQILQLRSTAFTVSVVGDAVQIVSKGFGHRVGMSQYGAEAMAAQGKDYRQILSHYYPGTELKTYLQN